MLSVIELTLVEVPDSVITPTIMALPLVVLEPKAGVVAVVVKVLSTLVVFWTRVIATIFS